ncbi:hypothetical protein HDV63DRAFT_399508 [Trichoderma sp. SZMC 28014]
MKLSILLVTAFFLASSIANKAAGKYQILFFYELYQLEVEANGVGNSQIAPGCAKNGVACDMKDFFNHICVIEKRPEKDANGDFIKPKGGGKPVIVNDPDFSKPNWNLIGDGADLGIFSTEIDKSDFRGSVTNNKIFKGWSKVSNFANVMDTAQDIGLKAIAKLRADGKEPGNDRINKITSVLKAHADARRFDQAGHICKAFEEYMKGKGFSVVYTDPIERPPVPGYRKIDTDETIADNQNKAGFDKVEQKVLDFVKRENSAGNSLSHVETILKTDATHDHFAAACKVHV